MDTEQQSIRFNDTEIRYTDSGEGIPTVFLHGYLEAKEIWQPFTKELPVGIRSICIDLPGHGQSTFRGDTITMEYMAQTIKHVLNNLRVNQCVVIGHSMGGYAALAFAELYPNMLLGLVLFHSTANPDTPEKRESRAIDIDLIMQGEKGRVVANAIPKGFATHNLIPLKDYVNWALNIAQRTPSNGIAACLRGMSVRKDRNFILGTPKCPTLLIFGSKDNHIHLQTAESISGRFAECESAFLHNSGHMGFLEETGESLRVLVPFILSCSSSE